MAASFGKKESLSLLAAREKQLLSALDRVLPRKKWGREELEDHQVRTLQSLVEHAYENVPFYREKYFAAGFHPSQVRRREDLCRIPMVTKEELRKAGTASLRSNKGASSARLLSTSGSSGIPVRVFRDEESLWEITANNLVWYYEWCDRRPIDQALYFVDLAPHTIDYALADLLRTTVAGKRIISIGEPTAVLIEKMKEFTPEFISSYPSTMRNVAISMRQNGASYDRLRLLHVTSEMLDQSTRLLLGRVFPRARIVETYTSTEAGLVAYQCPCTSRLHLLEDSLIIEIVDDRGNATQGLGEIVVTNLTNWTTPIIRYRGLGDYCRWGEAGCPCGSVFWSIQHLEGRRTESITLPDGSMVSPFLLTNAMLDVPGIFQYQIVQHSTTEMEVLVVKEGTSRITEDAIRAAVHHAFRPVLPGATRCQVRLVTDILPRAGTHKVPLVLSHLQGAS